MAWNVRRSATAALLAATLTAVLLPSAQADNDPKDRKRAVDAQVKELGDDLEDSSAEVKAAAGALDDAEAKLPPAQAALAAARTAVAGAQAAEFDAGLRLAATQAYAEQADIEYLGAKAQIKAHKEALGEMARAAYMGGDLQRLTLVMNAKSPDELTSALAYLGSVNRSEKVVLSDLDADQRDLAMKQATLAAAEERIAGEQGAATAAVAATGAARDTAAVADAQVQTLIAARATALATAEDLKNQIEKRLTEMKAESDRLARVIKARAEAARRAAERAGKKIGRQVTNGTGLLSRPVPGPVTSPFGMRFHPILRVYKQHTGVDLGSPSGTPVRAATAGKVLQAYYSSAWGNRVVVDHGYVNGVYLVTTYNHMTRSTVRPGDRLDRGEVLGYVGSTGYSTGPHLHFETLENGRFVNPMTWLG